MKTKLKKYNPKVKETDEAAIKAGLKVGDKNKLVTKVGYFADVVIGNKAVTVMITPDFSEFVRHENKDYPDLEITGFEKK